MSPPPIQIALAQKYGKEFGVDPKLLLAIGGHETQWGAAGAGRQGYTLGYGVTDSKTLSKYQGVENQYKYAASTLASWGVHTIADVQAGKAARYASDPAWEKGVAAVYGSLGGKLPTVAGSSNGRTPGSGPDNVGSIPTPAAFNPRPLALQSLGDLAAGNYDPVKALGATVQAKMAAKTELHPAALPSFTDASKSGASLASYAASEIGQPYVWGAESEKEGGFDCSGLVDFALRKQGYKGPRVTTTTLKDMGYSVRGKPLAPGDLILTHNFGHVVIYAGHGRVIAAPHTGANVQYQPLSNFEVDDVRRIAH